MPPGSLASPSSAVVGEGARSHVRRRRLARAPVLRSADPRRSKPMAMERMTAVRVLVAAGLVAAVAGGITVARQKAASSMALAATTFIDSLTPEQRQQALFALNAGEERTRWNFIP